MKLRGRRIGLPATPLVLAILLLALVVLDVVLAARARRRSEARDHLASLLDDEDRAFLDTASQLTIGARNEPMLRATVQDRGWACPDLFDVPLDPRALEALNKALASAEGRRLEGPSARSEHTGLDDPDAIVLELAASWREPLRVVLGRSIPVRDQSYARAPSGEVLLLDLDLGRPLARGPLGLVDRRLPAGAAIGRERLVRLEVDGPEGSFRLRLRAIERSPQELKDGAPPSEWVPEDARPRDFDPARAADFVGWMQAATWIAVLPPQETTGARGVLRWFGAEGAELRLELHERPDGGALVFNAATEHWFLIDERSRRRLFPPLSWLGSAPPENPWLAPENE